MLLAIAGSVVGQMISANSQSARAQAIQLPTFNQFSTNSSVLVPDRGSAYLGGVGRSTMGRNESGVPGLSKLPVVGRPFGNRATAGSSSASGVSVNAFIHDFEAMDEALHQQVAVAKPTQTARRVQEAERREAVGKKGEPVRKILHPKTGIAVIDSAIEDGTLSAGAPTSLQGHELVGADGTKHQVTIYTCSYGSPMYFIKSDKPKFDPPVMVAAPPVKATQSISSIRHQQSVQQAAERQREATAQTDDLTRADQLLAEGKPNVARIYLELAAKRAGDDPQQAELKQQIAARLQQLQRPAAVVTSTAR